MMALNTETGKVMALNVKLRSDNGFEPRTKRNMALNAEIGKVMALNANESKHGSERQTEK